MCECTPVHLDIHFVGVCNRSIIPGDVKGCNKVWDCQHLSGKNSRTRQYVKILKSGIQLSSNQIRDLKRCVRNRGLTAEHCNDFIQRVGKIRTSNSFAPTAELYVERSDASMGNNKTVLNHKRLLFRRDRVN